VLDRLSSTYAECRMYHDTGTVKTVSSDRTHAWVTSFKTAFDRKTGRFRFQYSDNYERGGEPLRDYFVAWTDGKTFRSWHRDIGVAAPDSLKWSLTINVARSRLTSLLVPTLLMPDMVVSLPPSKETVEALGKPVERWRLVDLIGDPVRLADEERGGA